MIHFGNKQSRKKSTARQPKYRDRQQTVHGPPRAEPSRPRRDSHVKQAVDQPGWRIWVRRLPITIAVTAIFISLIVVLVLDVSSAQVRVVTRADSVLDDKLIEKIVNENAYQESFQSELKNRILNRNKLTIQSGDIAADLMAAYPEIARAEIRFGIVDRLPVLHITLREPHLAIEEEDRLLLLDRRGVAFASIENENTVPEGIIKLEDSAFPGSDVGEQILPAETIDFIDQLVHQFRAKDVQVAMIALPAIANELHIQVEGDDYVGKFDITGDARLQAGAFFATRDRVAENNETPNEYIDVRVIGRTYLR